MKAKNNLVAKTSVGTFKRSSNKNYTHVVVWDSEYVKTSEARLKKAYGDKFETVKKQLTCYKRWEKNNWFEVTWHSTKAAAEKASIKCDFDKKAKCVGIFEVSISE